MDDGYMGRQQTSLGQLIIRLVRKVGWLRGLGVVVQWLTGMYFHCGWRVNNICLLEHSDQWLDLLNSHTKPNATGLHCLKNV